MFIYILQTYPASLFGRHDVLSYELKSQSRC